MSKGKAGKGKGKQNLQMDKRGREGIYLAPSAPFDIRSVVGLAKRYKDTQNCLSVADTVRRYRYDMRVARNGTIVLLLDALTRGYYSKIILESRRPGWESAHIDNRKKSMAIIFDIRATNEAITGSRGGLVPH